MKPTVKLLFSYVLSLLTVCSTQECKSHRLRGVRIQLASGPRNITVSLEKNHQLDITLGDKNRKSFTNEGRKCHTINIKEKESKFCVASPTLPFEEACGDGGDSLFLLSSMTATWTLDCPPDFGGRIGSCSGELHPQRLQAVLLGSDSEYFAFKWRPNDRDTSILPSWENFRQTFRGHNPSGWNDISVSRDVSGRPCRVSSRALDFNVSCDAEGNYMSFGSFNGDFREVASDFALPCEDLPQDSACRNPEGAPGTPSPGVAPAAAEPTLGGARGTPSPGVAPPKSPPTKPPWNVLAIVGAVALVVIAVVLVVVKVRKSRSSRQAAITADYLHDPGRDDDRKDDHDYCYIELAVVNAQLEHDGETTSLRSHDSENSLYGTGP